MQQKNFIVMIAPSLVISSGEGITDLLESISITKWLQNILVLTLHVFAIYVFFWSLKI